MTSERAEAYGRLMRRLRGLGPGGLLPHEEEQIREAADALLFCTGDPGDEQTRQSQSEAARLVEGLVHVGRWQEEDARHLLDDLEGCGPLTPVH